MRPPATHEPSVRLMIRAMRRFEGELLHRLHADGFADVTVAQTNVLRHLDNEGMRLSAWADDAGITKQGMGQAVKGLQARDLVAVEPDPGDRRAKRAVWTERGKRLVQAAIVHVADLEREWSETLGAAEYAQVRSALVRMGE